VRAAKLGLDVVELPSWYDVDDQRALDRLLRETEAPSISNGLLPYAAPRTAVALSRMGLGVANLNFAAE
jgi:hypothetical protein